MNTLRDLAFRAHHSLATFVSSLRAFAAVAPRELWFCFISKLLTSYSYFAFSMTIVLYLSDLDFSGTNIAFLDVAESNTTSDYIIHT